MSVALLWIRMYVALPLGVVFLVFAGIQAGTETRGDMVEMFKKIFLIGATVALISIYPTIIQKLSATADDFSKERDQLTEMVVMQRLMKNMGIEKRQVEAGYLSYLNPSSWINLFKLAMEIFDVALIYCILYVPSVLGFFMANILIKALLGVAIAFSPFFLSMIPFRQTHSTGMKFLLSTLALSVSLIALVVFDQAIRENAGAVIVAMLPAGVGAVAAGAGAAADLATVSTTIAAGSVAVGTLGFTAIVLLLAGFILMIILLTAYILTPFAFVRFATSGEILAAAGAMTGAMQVGRSSAMPVIESAEAVGRGQRASARQKTGAAVVAAETGVSTQVAASAVRAAGGDFHLAERALRTRPPAPPPNTGG